MEDYAYDNQNSEQERLNMLLKMYSLGNQKFVQYNSQAIEEILYLVKGPSIVVDNAIVKGLVSVAVSLNKEIDMQDSLKGMNFIGSKQDDEYFQVYRVFINVFEECERIEHDIVQDIPIF
jgi:hypothetical protein